MLIDWAIIGLAAGIITTGLDSTGLTQKISDKLFTKKPKKLTEEEEKKQLEKKQLVYMHYQWCNFLQATKLDNFRINKIEKITNGYKVLLQIPVSKSTEDVEKLKAPIENYFKCNSYINKIPYSNMVEVLIYTTKVNNYAYTPVKCNHNQVYLGKDEKGLDIIVELKRDPHFMFPGLTGSGKSFAEGIFITNLLYFNKQIELYLYQIGKSELDRYKSVPQCKLFADTLEVTAKHLQAAVEEINRRSKLFAAYGIADIEQYNKYANKEMKRQFHVFDEISFYAKDKTEVDENEVALKEICWGCLWQIVKAGRSVGIHFVGATQRITAEQLGGNGNLKSCLTFLCLKTNTEHDSELAIGTKDAFYLADREMIYKGNKGTMKIKIPTLDQEFKLLNHFNKDIKILDDEMIKKLKEDTSPKKDESKKEKREDPKPAPKKKNKGTKKKIQEHNLSAKDLYI